MYKNNCRWLLLIVAVVFMETHAAGSSGDHSLWYTHPAASWEEALPLGNGRLGAMVYGNALDEHLQLNESTLWSGVPVEGNNPEARIALPYVRQAIDRGDYAIAGKLWKAHAQGPYSARYLPLGDLYISMGSRGPVTRYRRELDLGTAVSTVSYEVGGKRYERRTIISYPAQLMVMSLCTTAMRQEVKLRLDSKLRHEVIGDGTGTLVLRGRAPAYVAARENDVLQVAYDEHQGMSFEIRVRVLESDVTACVHGGILQVRGGKRITLLLAAATSYESPFQCPATDCHVPSRRNGEALQNAHGGTWETLLADHLADYQRLYGRVNLRLGNTTHHQLVMPTDRRVKSFADDDSDGGLAALFFQYGRYLLIASSRPGGVPANLQGIWNDHIQPPWGSNYTLNINTEMNYWPAEVTNLSECFTPLADFIGRLAVNGAVTAKVNYGLDSCWVAHHNSDLWCKTSPTGGYAGDVKGDPRWSCWPMAGIWLCQHLWDHYAFTGDRQFLLRTAYPLMKGAARFAEQWLQRDNNGWLQTSPATSPENRFYYYDASGQRQEGSVSKGTTMDLALLRELLNDMRQTAKVLGDSAEATRSDRLLQQLQPYRIGRQGQLLEWFREFEEQDPHHRHVSHLLGLHPGRHILPRRDKVLTDAARRTLQLRGDGGTGWSMAWKINIWARLEDGNRAFAMLKHALSVAKGTEVSTQGGGVYPNLFDAHPPFQIDGNFGATAGIAEMLVQSHAGYIHLLPALPDAWSSGEVTGLKARGGFVIDMQWRNRRITELRVISTLGGPCRLVAATPFGLQVDGTSDYQYEAPDAINKVVEAADPPSVWVDGQVHRAGSVNLTGLYATTLHTTVGGHYAIVMKSSK